jgi:pyruvate dehydrogenase complex dehydrogenase (E1) component
MRSAKHVQFSIDTLELCIGAGTKVRKFFYGTLGNIPLLFGQVEDEAVVILEHLGHCPQTCVRG